MASDNFGQLGRLLTAGQHSLDRIRTQSEGETMPPAEKAANSRSAIAYETAFECLEARRLRGAIR